VFNRPPKSTTPSGSASSAGGKNFALGSNI
jgi:hypothetical protein